MRVVYIDEFSDERFDSKDECLASEMAFINAIRQTRFYNGRKRVSCKSPEEFEYAYSNSTRLIFPSVKAKCLIGDWFGFCASDYKELPNSRYGTYITVCDDPLWSEHLEFRADNRPYAERPLFGGCWYVDRGKGNITRARWLRHIEED